MIVPVVSIVFYLGSAGLYFVNEAEMLCNIPMRNPTDSGSLHVGLKDWSS